MSFIIECEKCATQARILKIDKLDGFEKGIITSGDITIDYGSNGSSGAGISIRCDFCKRVGEENELKDSKH